MKHLQDMTTRWLLTAILVLVGWTTRKVFVNWHTIEWLEKHKQPFIGSLWHNNLLYFTLVLRKKGLGAMVSQSRDGERIAAVLQWFGFQLVRGSTSRGALGALREYLRLLRAGQSVAITPDGPLGPRYVLQPGVVSLARHTGVPIVPLCISTPHCWEFSSWDAMKLPKPFSRVIIMAGDPFYVPSDANLEQAARSLERTMRLLVLRAERFSGGDLPQREPLLADSEHE